MSQSLDPGQGAVIWQRAFDALLALPERIGRYRVRGELGRGGMGIVYDAVDPTLDRPVAVKLIDPARLGEGVESGDLQKRFELEMRATSRLFHPNLVPILDAGVAEVDASRRAYYVMERIVGESLEERLRQRGPLPTEEALGVAEGIAKALTAVHASGLVHRDLKPSNVLLPEEGAAKLTDFGLCHLRARAAAAERFALVGSAHYIAPEQVRNGDVDDRADLYGLGAVLLKSLTGDDPFPASSLTRHLRRVERDEPDGLERLPAAIRRLVEQLMAKDPARRPASAALVAERLAGLRRQTRRGRSRRRLATLFTVATLGVCAGGLLLTSQYRSELKRLEAAADTSLERVRIQLERARRLAPALETLSRIEDAPPAERRALRDEVAGTLNRLAVERERHAQARATLEARRRDGALGFLLSFWPGTGPSEIRAAPGSPEGVDDHQGVLSTQEIERIEQQLRLLERELGVSARILIDAGTSNEALAARARRHFETLWPPPAGARALLLLVEPRRRQARVEVGSSLEALLPDAVLGELVREQLLPLLAGRDTELGIRLVLRVVRHTLRRARQAGAWPLQLAALPHGGSGAGATASLDEGFVVLPRRLGVDERARLSAAPTPAEAYARYRRWLETGSFDASVSLFGPATREMLAAWPISAPYLRSALDAEARGRVLVVERGDWAVVYARDDPLADPHFLHRAPEGWQVDLATGQRHVLHIAGGRQTWSLRGVGAEPLASFRDLLVAVDGLVRLRAGANALL